MNDTAIIVKDVTKSFKVYMDKIVGELKSTMTMCGAASLKELCYLCGVTDSVVKRLADKGALVISDTTMQRR